MVVRVGARLAVRQLLENRVEFDLRIVDFRRQQVAFGAQRVAFAAQLREFGASRFRVGAQLCELLLEREFFRVLALVQRNQTADIPG